MTTAFVLSGGASLGAVQVGMLQALFERHIYPDMVVGTSVGAVNAAWVAGDPNGQDIEDLVGIWQRLRRGDVFPVRSLAGLIGFLGGRSNLVPPDNLRTLLERHVRFARLEDAQIPIHVVTTDVISGEAVVLSEGDAFEALLASSAIPGVFPPVEIEGRHLMDGGISENTPVRATVRIGADRIYVLAAGYACALEEPPRGALGMVLHSLSLVMQKQLMDDISHAEAEVELHLIPPLCPLDVSPSDFSHAAELTQRARSSCGRWLEEPHRGAPQARYLAPHHHEIKSTTKRDRNQSTRAQAVARFQASSRVTATSKNLE
jgi:NTE family protein